MITRAFLGSNTPQGFCGYFEDTFDAAQTVILKGSPGSGKSTLMKKVGAEAEALGLGVEYYYCSGDPKSLDGVYIPTLKQAVLDGTAPHALDAPKPLLNEVVVNLADNADLGLIKQSGTEITELLFNKKQCFNRAYAYLKAAFCVLQQDYARQLRAVNNKAITAVTDDVFQLIRGCGCGDARRLFLNAVTPDGIVDYTAEFANNRKVIRLNAPPAVCERIIGELAARLDFYELSRLQFANPFTLGVSHLSVGEYFITPAEVPSAPYVYNIACVAYEDETSAQDFERLLSRAVACLNEARSCHIAMEKLYIPAMDFDDINKKTATILKRIFG